MAEPNRHAPPARSARPRGVDRSENLTKSADFWCDPTEVCAVLSHDLSKKCAGHHPLNSPHLERARDRSPPENTEAAAGVEKTERRPTVLRGEKIEDAMSPAFWVAREKRTSSLFERFKALRAPAKRILGHEHRRAGGLGDIRLSEERGR